MTLPEQVGDREYQKFVETADGYVAVRQGPGAINDSEGNELKLNKDGQASTFDIRAINELKNIHSLLEDIKFQLSLITEA
jgi:hypothetical protein